MSEPDVAGSGEAGTVPAPYAREVLRLVGQGLTNLDIAPRLVRSEHTVRRHLANLLRKLGLFSRAAAAAGACTRGLV